MMIMKYAHFLPRRNLFFASKSIPRLKEYQEKRVVGYTAVEMFDVAATVSEYPDFVPWCRSVDVKEHSQNLYTAHVQIGFPPVYETYTARISTVRPKIVRSVCTDKRLFKTLDTTWQFDEGQFGNPRSCTLLFSLAFEFRSAFHTLLAHQFFDHVVKTMVVAFLKRAEVKYGPPSLDHFKNYTVLKKVR